MEGFENKQIQKNQQIFDQKNIEQTIDQQPQFMQQDEQQRTLDVTKNEVKTAQSAMKSLLASEEVYGEKLEKKEEKQETEPETKQRQKTEKVRKFAVKCAQKFLEGWAKKLESDPKAEVPKLNIKIKGIEGLANATVLAAMAIRGHIMETYADKKEVLNKLLGAVNFNLIASDPVQEEGSGATDNIDFAPEVLKTAKVEAIDKSVKYSHDKEEKIPMGMLGANITSTVFYSLTKNNSPKIKSAKFMNTSKVFITKEKLSAEKMSEIESKCVDNGIYYVDEKGEVQLCTDQKLEELNKTIDDFKEDETKQKTIKEVVGAWKNTVKQEKKEENPDGKDDKGEISDTLEIDTTKVLEKEEEKEDKKEDSKEEKKEKAIEHTEEEKPKMTPKQAAEAIAEVNYKVRGCNVDKIHLEWDSTDLETVLRVQRELETRIKNINKSKARVPVAIKTAKKCIDEKVELLKENELSKNDYEIAMEALKVKDSEKESQKQLKKQKKAAIENNKQEEKLKKEKLAGTGEKIEEKDKLQQKDDTKEKKTLDKTEPVIEKKNEEKIIEKKNEDIVIEKKNEEKQDNDKNQSNEDDLNSSLNLDLDQMNKEKNDNNDKKENEELEKKLAEEKLKKEKEEKERIEREQRAQKEKERLKKEEEKKEQERLKKIAEEKEQERLKKIAEEKEQERLRKIEEERKAEEERLKAIEDEKKARKALKDELFGYRRENDEKEGHDYFKIRTQYDELLNLLAKEESDERNIDIYILTTQMHELTKDYKTHHKSWGIKKDNGKQRIAAVAKVNAIVENLQTDNKQYKDKAEKKLAQIEKEKQEEERIRQEKAKEEKLAKEKQEKIDKRKVDKKISDNVDNNYSSVDKLLTDKEKKQISPEDGQYKPNEGYLDMCNALKVLKDRIDNFNIEAAKDKQSETFKYKETIIYNDAKYLENVNKMAAIKVKNNAQKVNTKIARLKLKNDENNAKEIDKQERLLKMLMDRLESTQNISTMCKEIIATYQKKAEQQMAEMKEIKAQREKAKEDKKKKASSKTTKVNKEETTVSSKTAEVNKKETAASSTTTNVEKKASKIDTTEKTKTKQEKVEKKKEDKKEETKEKKNDKVNVSEEEAKIIDNLQGADLDAYLENMPDNDDEINIEDKKEDKKENKKEDDILNNDEEIELDSETKKILEDAKIVTDSLNKENAEAMAKLGKMNKDNMEYQQKMTDIMTGKKTSKTTKSRK